MTAYDIIKNSARVMSSQRVSPTMLVALALMARKGIIHASEAAEEAAIPVAQARKNLARCITYNLVKSDKITRTVPRQHSYQLTEQGVDLIKRIIQ